MESKIQFNSWFPCCQDCQGGLRVCHCDTNCVHDICNGHGGHGHLTLANKLSDNGDDKCDGEWWVFSLK